MVSNGYYYWWNESDLRQEWRIPDKNGKRQMNVNSDVFLAQLDHLQEAIKVKRLRRKKVALLHDNASPHIEHRVVEFIDSKGCELQPHPPYSPTEASTDYHVNRLLKNWQVGKVIYENFYQFLADAKAWIVSKDRHFFFRGIDRLPIK